MGRVFPELSQNATVMPPLSELESLKLLIAWGCFSAPHWFHKTQQTTLLTSFHMRNSLCPCDGSVQLIICQRYRHLVGHPQVE